MRATALAMGVVAWAAAPLALAQDAPLRLSAEQMQRAAELNLHNGDAGRALVFADALLERDPGDVPALLVRAYALRALADYAPARDAARAAWRGGTTDGQKYSAALVMAQALSSEGKRTRAQMWLRRAKQVAPSERHAQQAAQDFRHVQQRNPWQTYLSFTLAPNSNINNGSSRDTSRLNYRVLEAFGFDEGVLQAESKALSGIEAGLSVQSRYRFHQTGRSAHDLRFALSYRSFRLSGGSEDDLAASDAQRVARGEPARNITGGDFAYGTVQVGYGYKRLRADRRGEFSATADIGQSFYGGARLNRYLRASLGQSYHLDPTAKLDFGLLADLRTAGGQTDQNRIGLSTGLSRSLDGGDGLYVGVSVAAQRADAERLEYDEITLRSGYVLGREVMGTALRFGLSTTFRDYDVSPHDRSGRRDWQVAADVTATFRNIDYYGFNPTISLTASTTDSNIGLFDVNRVGIGFGIESSF